jgi:hypothetical protein
VEAYLYLYPLVTAEVIHRRMTNVAAGQLPGRAPMGQFAHIPAFSSADFKAVVRPTSTRCIHLRGWICPEDRHAKLPDLRPHTWATPQ